MIATHVSAGKPRSMLYRISQRIAERYEAAMAAAILAAWAQVRDDADVDALARALAQGKLTVAELEAILVGGLTVAEALRRSEGVRKAIYGPIRTASKASLARVGEALGIGIDFNNRDPNAIMVAREVFAELENWVSDDVREAIRQVTAWGQRTGQTAQTQARIIKEFIGLPNNWLDAPNNLADDIRNGRLSSATRRRLSAVDKARIRKRINEGTVTEEFIDEMRDIYTHRLRRARANTIARDATSRAANHGQRLGWKQAIDAGELPTDVRRFVVVTPDDRLRTDHARVPLMNTNGRLIDEPYETPWGPRMVPPWEGQPNCRCGETLLLPNRMYL